MSRVPFLKTILCGSRALVCEVLEGHSSDSQVIRALVSEHIPRSVLRIASGEYLKKPIPDRLSDINLDVV